MSRLSRGVRRLLRRMRPRSRCFYSQFGEDRVLGRLFPSRQGFYVDVGAYDPTLISNTRHFYDLGWRGINVEPSPTRFGRFVAERPRDVNLNVGIDEEEAPRTYFQMEPDALSTFDREEAMRCASFENHRIVSEVPVPTVRLSTVLDAHAPPRIDFLSIDTEGGEASVIRSNDWNRHRPVVVLIEYRRYHPTGTDEVSTPEWESVLREAGYERVFSNYVNAFYLRAEDAHLRGRL